MLQISSLQTQALARSSPDEVLAILGKHLRQRFEALTKGRSDEEIGRFVQTAIDRANAFGELDLPDLALFTDLCVLYGPEFSKQPWAEDIFSLEDLSLHDRLDAVAGRVRRVVPQL